MSPHSSLQVRLTEPLSDSIRWPVNPCSLGSSPNPHRAIRRITHLVAGALLRPRPRLPVAALCPIAKQKSNLVSGQGALGPQRRALAQQPCSSGRVASLLWAHREGADIQECEVTPVAPGRQEPPSLSPSPSPTGTPGPVLPPALRNRAGAALPAPRGWGAPRSSQRLTQADLSQPSQAACCPRFQKSPHLGQAPNCDNGTSASDCPRPQVEVKLCRLPTRLPPSQSFPFRLRSAR